MDEIDIESIIREREERDRKAEEVYKKQIKKGSSLILNTINIIYVKIAYCCQHILYL
jgi:hypothetical protein